MSRALFLDFRACPQTKWELVDLVESINDVVENRRSESDIQHWFERLWPHLRDELEGIPVSLLRVPSQIQVERILCAATPQFEELGAERDYETPELHYPGAITITSLRGIGFTQLRDALSGKKFRIVHLLGFVEHRSGEFVFGDGDRLPGNALLRLLEPFQAELIFLATCDSLTLGAILSRSLSIIAASDNS